MIGAYPIATTPIITLLVSFIVHEVTVTDGMLMLDPATKEESHTLTDKLQLDDNLLSLYHDKILNDYLLLSETENKEHEKILLSQLLLVEELIKVFGKTIQDDSLLIGDSYASLLIEALATALVFAKVKTVDDYMNITVDIVSPE